MKRGVMAAGSSEPFAVRIPEAVRLSGLSRSRLYELLASGDIQFAKVGSSTLVLVDSLRAFIETRTVEVRSRSDPR